MQISSGIKYILLASLFFSIINALVKYLSTIPAIEIVFFRSLVTLLISGYTVFKLKLKIINKDSPVLFARGLSGAIALSLYFYTIQHMPLATAVTILYLAPIFTVLFAIVLVKEKPNSKQWPFFFLCFLGAALMKNFDPRVSLLHFSMGIFAAMFAGLAYNFIRMLKGRAHHALIIFYFPLVTIPFCLPWLIKSWKTPNISEFIILITIGVLTQCAQVFMTKGYLSESASKVSHFNYTTCFYAFLTGIIFFNEHLNWISIIGLILVFIGIVFATKYAPESK